MRVYSLLEEIKSAKNLTTRSKNNLPTHKNMNALLKLLFGFLGTIIIFYLLVRAAIKIQEIEKKGESKLEKNLSMYVLLALVIITILGTSLGC